VIPLWRVTVTRMVPEEKERMRAFRTGVAAPFPSEACAR